jgi:Flp pilus assembly pilin Flp
MLTHLGDGFTRSDPEDGRRDSVTLSPRLNRIRTSPCGEEGQTMAEYAVVLALVVLVAVAVFTAVSGGISGAVNNVTALF